MASLGTLKKRGHRNCPHLDFYSQICDHHGASSTNCFSVWETIFFQLLFAPFPAPGLYRPHCTVIQDSTFLMSVGFSPLPSCSPNQLHWHLFQDFPSAGISYTYVWVSVQSEDVWSLFKKIQTSNQWPQPLALPGRVPGVSYKLHACEFYSIFHIYLGEPLPHPIHFELKGLI